MSTNDYYLKVIYSATLVQLGKINQTCLFTYKSMKSEKFLFQLFLTMLKIADFKIALNFKILKMLKIAYLNSIGSLCFITSAEKYLRRSPFILQFKFQNKQMKTKNKDSLM